MWGSPELAWAEEAPRGKGWGVADRGGKMGKERESPPGARVAGVQHQRLPCVGLRASRAHPTSLCRRMGCMRSKFLQDRGKVSKSEPSASPHSPVYVPDPTSSSKRVSGGHRGMWGKQGRNGGCPVLPQITLTASCFPKGERVHLG